MTKNSVNINRSIAKGAGWMVSTRFLIKGLSVISTIILARLLAPEDFGLVALSMSVFTMFELLKSFGFQTVLIQKQEATRVHYDSAWTMGLIFSLFTSFLLAAFSYQLADFYEDSRLIPMFGLLAAMGVIGSLANIGTVDFQKEMEFHKEFKLSVLVKLAGFFVTIPLAYILRSYWALLIGMLTTTSTNVILSYVMHSYRPKLALAAWRELMSFSSWLMLNNLLGFLIDHVQNFMLGKYSGARELGIFSISKEISTITTAELVAPINRAAYPGYAKISDNKEELKKTYLKVVGIIILVATPSALGMAAISPLLVPIALGNSWLDAIPLIQTIAIASALISVNTNSAYIYLATGNQQIITFILAIQITIFLSLLFLLLPDKAALGAAQAVLYTAIIIFPLNQYFLKVFLNLKWISMIKIIYRPLIASIIMGAIVNYFIVEKGTQIAGIVNIGFLFVMLFTGILSYILPLLLLWFLVGKPNSPEKIVIDIFYEKFLNKNSKS